MLGELFFNDFLFDLLSLLFDLVRLEVRVE